MSYVKIWLHCVWSIKNRDNIKNQHEHHKKMSWDEEVDLFLEKYGFERITG